MYRFAFRLRFAAAALVFSFGAAAPAYAQELVPAADGRNLAAALAQVARPASQVFAPAAAERAVRPAPLVPLYVSFASLQALDVHSTTRALNRGGVEGNPLLKGIAGNPVALSALKIGGSAATIYAAEKMWKKNRKTAILFMLAANAGMAFIVQHNYRAVK